MPLTDIASNKLTAHLFGRVLYDPPQVLYIALSTAEPRSEKGEAPYWNFVEPEGNNYKRINSSNTVDNWSFTENNQWSNKQSFEFERATGSWGIIRALGIYDQPEDGNLLCFGLFWNDEDGAEAPQRITAGDMASFPAGFITIRMQ